MIYLVRHGQTEFNREKRLQGHVDSPLTDLGRRQATAVGALLKELIGDAKGWKIVASPLLRTIQTAHAIAAALDVDEIDIDRRLIELSWGEWDGKLRAELEAAYPDTFGKTSWAFDAPTGETYDEVCGRLQSWMDELPPEPQRKVIAVSHGVSGRVLRGLYANLAIGEAVKQDVPQDAVFRLTGGVIERIDCAPVG